MISSRHTACARGRSRRIGGAWQRDWEIVVGRLRAEVPERVKRVELEARANHLRYRSYLAYEAGDFISSRKLLVQAFAAMSPQLLADRRTWITTAAVIGSLLPESLHKKLAGTVKGLRSRLSAKRPPHRA